MAVSYHVRLYTDLLQALKGKRLSSAFSPDGTLISASAAPHCGEMVVWTTTHPNKCMYDRFACVYQYDVRQCLE